MLKKKYYVVWKAKKKGIFSSWDDCKKSVQGYKRAKYKSFDDKFSAEKAFNKKYEEHIKTRNVKKELTAKEKKIYGEPIPKSISVDAACKGNPGIMEYRGVVTATSTILFSSKEPYKSGTNNIGEFLALVHALAWLKKKKQTKLSIYSDSKIAINWVYKKKCKTKLEENEKNKKLFEHIKRAENWLKNNSYKNKIIKWNTKVWEKYQPILDENKQKNIFNYISRWN